MPEPLGNKAQRCYSNLKEYDEMTIQLPNDLESSIRAAVSNGRFASVDDAMAEAARLLLREISQNPQSRSSNTASDVDPVLGCMKDDAELMDQIVADAYRQRREETWRELDL
jgi:Arc/MetJ-type ribon-helix-helix transcriptional regulator